MASSGLTDNGLVIEVVDDLRSGMEQDLRDAFFDSLPLGDQTLLGHIVGMLAVMFGRVWERLEEVNSSQDPDKATGPALDAVSILTGTFRQPATSSFATLTLCGTPGTVVASGSVVATSSTSTLWDTRDTVTITALTNWAITTAYIVGDRRTNASRCYECITAGTSAGAGGPTTTATDITDGSVHWKYIGEGTGAIDVVADAELTGPLVAVAYDLSVIQTPVSGWSSVLNLLDATEGTNEATDEELRLVRALELAGAGASTKDALRAALLKVTGVNSAFIFNNTSDTTDGDGLPPHSFEVLIRGGAVQDIVDTIANNQPAGIATYSSAGTFGTHTDTQGTVVTVYYTRPTDINVYVDITVEYDASLYPTDGDAEIKEAISTWGQGFLTGGDVDPTGVLAQAFSIAGVRGVPRVEVYTDVINGSPAAWAATTAYSATVGARSVVLNDNGRAYICITSGTSAGSGGPTGTGTDITDGTVHWRYLGNKITITSRQLAVFDTTRIAVHSSAVTP